MGDPPSLPFYQLVLIRNGESELARDGIFCGWADSDISYKGECQAEAVGKLLFKKRVEFDIAFTSYLKRAIKTCHIILEQMGLDWINIQKSWRLNPQMFGMLQGCYQTKLVAQYGDDQVISWGRDYVSVPPPLSQNSRDHPIFENKYAFLDKTLVPDTECLRDSYERMLPFWCDEIVPAIKEGNRVLVVAHESTLRVLVKHVDHISDENIAYNKIPPCTPLVYDFDEQMRPIRHYYLMNDGTIQDAISGAKQDPCSEPYSAKYVTNFEVASTER